MLTMLVQHGALQAGPAGVPGALVVVALLTLLTGRCETGFAASGLGQLVTMLPYHPMTAIAGQLASNVLMANDALKSVGE